MILHIFHPGPSLTRCEFRIGIHDPIICVNKARDFIGGHDWWVCGGAGRPGVIDSQYLVDERTRMGVVATRLVGCPPRLPESPAFKSMLFSDFGLPVTSYSSLAALHLARYLGNHQLATQEPVRIHIYGHDLAGDRYYDGTPGQNLDPERWRHEAGLWEVARADVARTCEVVIHKA
jgi:hypothetical protein